MFDSKVAVVVRDDLAVWQKLNVTAFVVSGLVGASPELIGRPYEDRDGGVYNALLVQPVVVLAADAPTIAQIFARTRERGVPVSLYIDDMFQTGGDEPNCAAVKQYAAAEMKVVGLAMRTDKKIVDKITKGAKLHG